MSGTGPWHRIGRTLSSAGGQVVANPLLPRTESTRLWIKISYFYQLGIIWLVEAYKAGLKRPTESVDSSGLKNVVSLPSQRSCWEAEF